jgi:phage terminase large subunit-like protein
VNQRHRPDGRAVPVWHRYARDVVAGKIIAGPLVRLACERHLRDMEDGKKRGLRFDEDRAAHAVGFFPAALCLAEGEHAGKAFELQPWQQFIIASIFGWLGPDGFRRFRTAYIEIGKGNGKSPMAGGVGLYGLLADDEPGAEIYSAAVNRDQARILWTDAEKMVDASPALKRRIDSKVNNLAVLATHSYFRPVSAEARGLDGKRVHMALIDELHEHPAPLVVDKMRAGTKGRRQALIFEITNSGYNRHTVCWHHHEYSQKILEGSLENDSWFAYVCGLDPEIRDGDIVVREADDWHDETVWLKANPNLGVSVTLKYLREQVQEAIGMPSKEAIVRRLNFCEWTQAHTVWITDKKWMLCAEPVDAQALLGRECYGGLDLASTIDIAAFVLYFPADGDDPLARVLPFFWIPADGVNARSEQVPYKQWLRAGLLKATDGTVIDYDVIRQDISELYKQYGIRAIAYDRWNATQLVTQLEGDGLTMVPWGQGFQMMTVPTRALETMVTGRQIAHGGHPILRWMAGNTVAQQDAAGNIKPDKGKSTEKIDGIVALIEGIGCSEVTPAGTSRYDQEGEEMIIA